MADLTVNTYSAGSLTDSLTAAAGGGDAIPAYTGKEWLEVNNGGGSSINVTLVSQYVPPAAGTAAASLVVAVAAGARKKIKAPAPKEIWTDVNGKLQITYSGVTSVTVGAFRWPE